MQVCSVDLGLETWCQGLGLDLSTHVKVLVLNSYPLLRPQ